MMPRPPPSPPRRAPGDFIEPFDVAAVLLVAMPFELVLAQFFQHADFAVGRQERFAAAFDFRGQPLPLLQGLLFIDAKRDLVALRFDQEIDIDRSRPGGFAASDRDCRQFPVDLRASAR